MQNSGRNVLSNLDDLHRPSASPLPEGEEIDRLAVTTRKAGRMLFTPGL